MEIEQLRIGASEVAAVLGISPYKSPLEWWAQKTGRAEAFGGNAATVLGQYLEDGIARLFADQHRVRLEPGCDVRHPELPWMAATPDRLVPHEAMSAAFQQANDIEPGEVVLLEVKTSGLATWRPLDVMQREWGDEGSSDIPIGYAAQVQQQIAVVDADLRARGAGFCRRAYVKALIPGRGVPEFRIDADPGVAAWIREGLEHMVREHVLPDVMPEPLNPEDWKLREELLPRAFKGKDARRAATADEEALIAEFRRHRAAETLHHNEAVILRGRIIEAIGDDYALDFSAGRVSYSSGKQLPTLRKAQALDEVLRWSRAGAPFEAQLAIDEIVKRCTHSRWTGRRLTTRFVDEKNDDQPETGDRE